MRHQLPLVLRSALAATCLIATPALADTPGVSNCTVPACIVLVGLAGDVPAVDAGEFVVTIRDLANNPIQGAIVAIDLSIAPDVRFASLQTDGDLVVDCAASRVHKLSDVHGQARFTIVGRGTGDFSPGQTGSIALVYWDQALIGSPVVKTYDLDGQLGLGAADFSMWISEFYGSDPSWALDYDCSGTLGANDLSVWLTAYGRGTQTSSAGAVCP